MSECRSLTNFIGNAVATVVVARWDGALDRGALAAALDGRPAPLAAATGAIRAIRAIRATQGGILGTIIAIAYSAMPAPASGR